MLLALSVVIPSIYKKYLFNYSVITYNLLIKSFKLIIYKKLTLVIIPKSLRLLRKNSLMFFPECEPSSLTKSNKIFFNSHSFEIQCAIIPRKGDDVQASIVKDILPPTSYKN